MNIPKSGRVIVIDDQVDEAIPFNSEIISKWNTNNLLHWGKGPIARVSSHRYSNCLFRHRTWNSGSIGYNKNFYCN